MQITELVNEKYKQIMSLLPSYFLRTLHQLHQRYPSELFQYTLDQESLAAKDNGKCIITYTGETI